MSKPNEYSLMSWYDEYVDYYNQSGKKTKDHIPILAELSKIQKLSLNRIKELRNIFEELKDDLTNILEEHVKDRNRNLLIPVGKHRNIKELKQDILISIDCHIKYNSATTEDDMDTERLEELISQFFEIVDNQDQFKGIMFYVSGCKALIPKYQRAVYHYNALKKLCDKIIDNTYPPQLESYENLSEEEKNEITTKKYTTYHNTRDDLVKDLRSIITSIKNKDRFFHDDGVIKHTTVAKHAVSQEWFADKHGHGERGLHEHIKGIYKNMNST